MAYIKNTSGQGFGFVGVKTSDGTDMTGTTGLAVYRTIDGATQTAADATVTDQGHGQYWVALSQADTNGDKVSYKVGITGMISVERTLVFEAAAIITSGTGTNQISVSSGKVLLQATQPGVTIPTVTTVGTLTTYTGNTPQTGDAYARIGAAGAGLTAIGDTRMAHLDADVSSRLAPAGTLATVTNLTNAPTSGDFTAAMKSSITTAATAATPTVAAVTGNIGGNVVGSVASVVSKTGYSLATAPPTASAIATAVLTDTGDQSTSGSLGKLTSLLITALNGTAVFTADALANAPTGGGGSGPTASEIATAVWQDTTSGDFTVSGSSGYKLFTSGVPVSDKTGFSLTSAYDDAKTAAQAGDAMTLAADGLDAVMIEDMNIRQAITEIAAVLCGKSTGVDTGSPSFQGIGVDTVRLTATAANGNRSAVNFNLPS